MNIIEARALLVDPILSRLDALAYAITAMAGQRAASESAASESAASESAAPPELPTLSTAEVFAHASKALVATVTPAQKRQIVAILKGEQLRVLLDEMAPIAGPAAVAEVDGLLTIRGRALLEKARAVHLAHVAHEPTRAPGAP